jgi:DNA adenine methylase
MIGRVALYAANTVIDRLDWRECIRPYDKPKTLFYYDPPYFHTEDYGFDFVIKQYELLTDAARSIKGKWKPPCTNRNSARDVG